MKKLILTGLVLIASWMEDVQALTTQQIVNQSRMTSTVSNLTKKLITRRPFHAFTIAMTTTSVKQTADNPKAVKKTISRFISFWFFPVSPRNDANRKTQSNGKQGYGLGKGVSVDDVHALTPKARSRAFDVGSTHFFSRAE